MSDSFSIQKIHVKAEPRVLNVRWTSNYNDILNELYRLVAGKQIYEKIRRTEVKTMDLLEALGI